MMLMRHPPSPLTLHEGGIIRHSRAGGNPEGKGGAAPYALRREEAMDASLFNSDSRYRSSLRCLEIRENRRSPRKLRLPSNPLLKSSQGLDRDAGT